MSGSLGFGWHYLVSDSIAATETFTEDFTTRTYEDTTNTDAYWNVRDNQATLHTDGSFSWGWVKPLPQGLRINDVAWLDATTALAVGDNGVILRTTDTGTTWTVTNYGGGLTKLTGISVPMPPMMVYVSAWDGTVLKSIDGGLNWAVCGNTGFTISQPNDLYFVTASTGWVVGESGKIASTVDGCTNWNMEATGTVRDLNAIDGAVGGNVIAVGGRLNTQHAVVYYDGLGWNNATYPFTNPMYDISLYNAAKGVLVGTDGTLITTDGGVNWVVPAVDPVSAPAYAAESVKTAEDMYVAGDYSGKLHRTLDGGTNWNTVQTFAAEGFNFDVLAIDFIDSNNGLAVGDSGMIFKTADAGVTWTAFDTPLTARTFESIQAPNENTVYITGQYSVAKSINSGSTWTPSTNAQDNYEVFFVDDNNGWRVGYPSTAYKTTNGGVGWTNENTGIDVNCFLWGVFFLDENVGWVVGSGEDSNTRIYKTINGGTLWTEQITGYAGGFNDIFFLNSNVGYALGDLGRILKTTDGGAVWSLQASGTGANLSTIYCYDADNCFVTKEASTDTYLYTVDGGTNWLTGTFAATDTAFYRIKGLDQNVMMVSGYSTIQYTINGGSSWTAISDDSMPKQMHGLDFITGVRAMAVGDVIYANQAGSLIEIYSGYAAAQTVQSLTVDTVSQNITAATLTATDVLNGQTIDYYLSANGGVNWEAVTSGVEYTFVNAGSDLRWRADLSTAMATMTPEITNIGISYNYTLGGSPPAPPPPVYLCNDGIDNDNDGLTDYPFDLGCSGSTDNDESGPYACSDGTDNDGDGKVDFPADLGCSGSTDNDEAGPYQCGDGIDNDLDGKIDFPADPDCATLEDDNESTIPQCKDGIDNDLDGKIDFPADPDCVDINDDNEEHEYAGPAVIGSPADGLLTNNSKPTIKGTTIEASLPLDIYIDEVKVKSLTSGIDKSFEWTVETALTDGEHKIYIKSGGLNSAVKTITVDTVAPLVPAISSIKIKSQKLSGENVSVEMEFSGTTTADTKYVALYVDNQLIDNVGVVASAWKYSVTRVLTPGIHKVAVKSMDAANNISVFSAASDLEIKKIVVSQCNNKIDDDKDSLIDFPDDPGCSSLTDDSENSEFTVLSGETRDIELVESGTLVNIQKGGTLGFKIANIRHTFKIENVNLAASDSGIIIESDPIKARIIKEAAKQFDVDRNGKNDLEIKLTKAVSANQIIMTIRKVREIVEPKPVPKPIAIIPEIKPEAPPVEPPIAPVPPPAAGGGESIPEKPIAVAPPINILQDPEKMQQVADIKEKNEWEKSADERAQELEFETESIFQSDAVQNTTKAISNVISAISGVDYEQVKAGVDRTAKSAIRTTKQVQQATVDNPVAEQANDVAKAPVIATVTATSVASVATVGVTGVTGATAITYIQFVVSQAFLMFVRRKKERWGVVYNSVTKRPVDLAVVRIYTADSSQLVRTLVTDKQGRYQFILKPGKYFMSVEKKGFKFPSGLLNNAGVDGNFQNVYYGSIFEVTEKETISPPIALDPSQKLESPKGILRKYFMRKGQSALTMIGPTLAIASFVINPQWWVGAIVVSQLAMYGIFKKLGIGEKAKSFGEIKDVDEKKKIGRSIVRVFDSKFNKLLDTQVADSNGRYAFLVGNQIYYLTADKPGYFSKRSPLYNLAGKESGYLAQDLFLKKHNLGEDVVKAQSEGENATIRTDIGRQTEAEVMGMKKVVRKEGEKFTGKLEDVNLDELHEDFYDVDTLKKT